MGRIFSIVVAVLLLLSVTDVSLAQSADELLNPPKVGTLVVPRAELEAWKHPPSVLFPSRGETVTKISPNINYKVLEIKIIRSLLFDDRYYTRIEEAGDGKTKPYKIQDCWVYLGPKASGVTPNLLVRKKD